MRTRRREERWRSESRSARVMMSKAWREGKCANTPARGRGGISDSHESETRIAAHARTRKRESWRNINDRVRAEGHMLKLADIMTRDVVTVTPETSLREVIDLFTAKHISGAPVVSGHEVVGVISAADILGVDAARPEVETGADEVAGWV